MARRRADIDDEDEDDRPRSRPRSRRRDEADEDDDPRPKRRPRPADEEDDERPRRIARARDDEDDEDDRPRRRKPRPAGMSKGLLFGLIGGGVALVLVVLLIVFFGGGTVSGPPKAVFEAYVKELKAGRSDRALKYLATPGRSDLESDSAAAGVRPGEQLAREVAESRWFHQPFTVAEEKIDPSGTKARLTLRFGPSDVEFGRDTMEVDLVKEGSKWKIDF